MCCVCAGMYKTVCVKKRRAYKKTNEYISVKKTHERENKKERAEEIEQDSSA